VPLYEYQCKKCKHKFEKIQKFSDRQVKKCPECGGPVEQLLHAPAVQFKGSGFYVNDYANKSQTSNKSSGQKEDAAGAAKEKSDSDAKTKASKPETKKATKES
jgi:putative FmdB family regulatory protein